MSYCISRTIIVDVVRLDDGQLQAAADLWSLGKDTVEIAAALSAGAEVAVTEASVYGAMPAIKAKVWSTLPSVVSPAAPKRPRRAMPQLVDVPAWVPRQYRRRYVEITLASGEEAAASDARAALHGPLVSA
jgi:hypothetical protein